LRTRNNHRVYDLINPTDSSVARLVLEWVEQARAHRKFVLQPLIQALCSETSIQRPAVIPAELNGDVKINWAEHPLGERSMARLREARGHLLCEAAMLRTVALFPELDAADAMQALRNAQKADAEKWHTQLEQRLQNSTKLDEFCSLLAVHQGYDHLNDMIAHMISSHPDMGHLRVRTQLVQIREGKADPKLLEAIHDVCPDTLRVNFMTLCGRDEPPAHAVPDIRVTAIQHVTSPDCLKTHQAFWQAVNEAATILNLQRDPLLHALLQPDRQWLSPHALPKRLHADRLPNPETFQQIIQVFDAQAVHTVPERWAQRVADPVRGVAQIHEGRAALLRDLYARAATAEPSMALPIQSARIGASIGA